MKYPGILAEPIVRWSGGLLDSNAELAVEYMGEAVSKRIDALFNLFAIDRRGPFAWQELAIALAAIHVQGFQIVDEAPRGPGAPGSWVDGRHYQLLADVRNLGREKGLSIQKACNEIARSEHYSERYGGLDGETLRRQYYKAVKFDGNGGLLDRLFKIGEARGEPIWDWLIHAYALPLPPPDAANPRARPCLMCSKNFLTNSPTVRICPDCKKSKDWRDILAD